MNPLLKKGQGHTCKSYISSHMSAVVLRTNPGRQPPQQGTNSVELNFIRAGAWTMLARCCLTIQVRTGWLNSDGSSFVALDALKWADVVVFVSETSGTKKCRGEVASVEALLVVPLEPNTWTDCPTLRREIGSFSGAW